MPQGLDLWTENVDIRCLYAYDHLPYKQWHINEFYSRIYKHYFIYIIHIFLFIVDIIYIEHYITWMY